MIANDSYKLLEKNMKKFKSHRDAGDFDGRFIRNEMASDGQWINIKWYYGTVFSVVKIILKMNQKYSSSHQLYSLALSL